MAWELRHGGHRYLYRNHRVNGKPVKQYLGAAHDGIGFGELMAYMLGRIQRRSAKLRKLRRRARAEYRAGIDDLLRATVAANTDLRVLVDGTLRAVGYHRHHRGEWRMKRELMMMRNQIGELERRNTERQPLLNYPAPANDAEAVELFAKARAGDANALARVRAFISERKLVNWIGDIGREATGQLIRKAAGGDPVWEAGLIQKANNLTDQLLGEKPR